MSHFQYYRPLGGGHGSEFVPAPYMRAKVASLATPDRDRERGLFSAGWYLPVDVDYIQSLQDKKLIEPAPCLRCGKEGKVFHLLEPWFRVLIELKGE